MTIDEFMRDIAPKMLQGWIFMDKNGWWYYTDIDDAPVLEDDWETSDFQNNLDMFDIAPVDDWTQSLRKVGCDE